MPDLLPLAVDASTDGCCGTPDAGLDADAARDVARTFKALADPARVRLLSLIAAQESGEACICDLTGPVGLSQPTVSHHMATLAEAGLVTREQRGRWAHFRVAGQAHDLVAGALAATLAPATATATATGGAR
ncbi:ArsR/SmtB family transcription factor [Cellulomonas telluris]|uniref:ArsR/SmtB family transcription factor n=1 Tax=Cellulomonas telluris TaxID=2306636 RepID=UPI0010A86674|nr:metalloregulator ArsR/SmtB family transcription factor [Cellulomonas telluris]